jgi:hypothetical protein
MIHIYRRPMLETLRWLWTMYRVRRAYFELGFSRRLRFMDELRPKIDGGRIAMPDGIMLATAADYRRAWDCSADEAPPP